MTAPALAAQWNWGPSSTTPPISDVPVWRIDTLVASGDAWTDDQGRQWVINAEKGWDETAALKTMRTDKPYGSGSFRSAAYRKERVLTLGGSVWCPDWATRERTALQLAALCSDPGKLYDYRRTTNTFDQLVHVELDDAPLISMVTPQALTFSFQFCAPDPRKKDVSWQAPQSTLPVAGTGGLDFSAPGLDYTTTGVTWSDTPTLPGIGALANYGTAPAYPCFQVTGAVSGCSIVDLDRGWTLTYGGNLGPTDVLTINCDPFSQRGVPAHSVLVNGTADARTLLTVGIDWPTVAPQSVSHYQLNANPTTGAVLMSYMRSQYH